jgi:polysaccharide export outer membrane protein
MPRHAWHLMVTSGVVLALALGNAAAQSDAPLKPPPPNYEIGPYDVLLITVWGQEDISGKYTVEQDGSFTFPLLGRVSTRGLTLRAFELQLSRQLAEGLFKDPQVTASVLEYHSRRVFVVGEVRQPGTHVLSGDMSVIEVLARAGSTTTNAADHLLVVRSAHAGSPVLPNQPQATEVIRVELSDIEGGELSKNVSLQNGDTVFVPRSAVVYVTGRVRSPGGYPLGQDMTVLQALALAGGATDFGATNRIRIRRVVAGTEREIKVELTTLVEAGDTIVVPERFF